MCENKYFPRKKVKRIPISSLPCRYRINANKFVRFIKIVCTKGVHINVKNMKLIGARSEDIATSEDQFELFKLMVVNPQRIMYL